MEKLESSSPTELQQLLKNLVVDSQKGEDLVIDIENHLVKQFADQFSTLNSGRFDNSIYFFMLTFVGICSYAALAVQMYQRDKANIRLQEATRQLDEEKMQRFQFGKMSVLGEMAAGVAHEVNNPLGIIIGYLAKLKRLAAKSEHEKEIFETADKIEATANRISKIVKGLLDFSRDGHKDPMIHVPLNEIVEETLVLSKARVRKRNIRFDVLDCPKEIYVNCRPTQISQIILNLINNSADEIENGDDPWIKISFVLDKNKIQVQVTDSGPGISREIQEKIFNPFFTSKEIGKGVGLGLSISKGIAEDHEGRLFLDNKCSNTRFVLELPIV